MPEETSTPSIVSSYTDLITLFKNSKEKEEMLGSDSAYAHVLKTDVIYKFLNISISQKKIQDQLILKIAFAKEKNPEDTENSQLQPQPGEMFFDNISLFTEPTSENPCKKETENGIYYVYVTHQDFAKWCESYHGRTFSYYEKDSATKANEHKTPAELKKFEKKPKPIKNNELTEEKKDRTKPHTSWLYSLGENIYNLGENIYNVLKNIFSFLSSFFQSQTRKTPDTAQDPQSHHTDGSHLGSTQQITSTMTTTTIHPHDTNCSDDPSALELKEIKKPERQEEEEEEQQQQQEEKQTSCTPHLSL